MVAPQGAGLNSHFSVMGYDHSPALMKSVVSWSKNLTAAEAIAPNSVRIGRRSERRTAVVPAVSTGPHYKSAPAK